MIYRLLSANETIKKKKVVIDGLLFFPGYRIITTLPVFLYSFPSQV